MPACADPTAIAAVSIFWTLSPTAVTRILLVSGGGERTELRFRRRAESQSGNQRSRLEYPHYERAVIVTGDGDFGCLVRYLYERQKLERVLSPNRTQCSALLKRAARERLDFLEDARRKIEHKN